MSILLSILFVLIRAFILGGIVFIATTKIPANPIATQNKIIISVMVVILFALTDYISQYFRGLKNMVCRVACGASSDDLSTVAVTQSVSVLAPMTVTTTEPSLDDFSNIDLSVPKVDSELEEAIKALHSETEYTPKTAAALSEEEQRHHTGEEHTPLPAEAEGFANYGPF